MMLLSIHIVAITLLIAVVWSLAYRAGQQREARRWRRRLAQQEQDGASPEAATHAKQSPVSATPGGVPQRT